MFKRTIIILFAISLPLGQKLNELLIVNVSLMYIVVTFLALIGLPFVKDHNYKIPAVFKFFYIFALIHVFFVYFVINPNLILENHVVSLYGITLLIEPNYIYVSRYLLYLLSPIVIAAYINEQKDFALFLRVFMYALLTSVILCFLYEAIAESNIRFSGGFQDPNTFGGFCSIALFSSMYLNFFKKRKFNIFSILFLILLISSQSRACMLGLAGSAFGAYCLKVINRKTFVYIIASGIIGVFIMSYFEMSVLDRFENISNSENDYADLRVIIWLYYLSEIENYFLLGNGFGRVTQIAVIASNGSEQHLTHNQYLLQMVQYGVFGLFFYLRTWFDVFKKTLLYTKFNMSLKPIVLLFINFLVIMFFSDYDNTREHAMIISIFFIVYNMHKKYI